MENNKYKIEGYKVLWDEITKLFNNTEVAIAVLKEMGKDKRGALAVAEREKAYGYRGNRKPSEDRGKELNTDSSPATPKQVSYLKRILGEHKVPGNLSKQGASKLIDEFKNGGS